MAGVSCTLYNWTIELFADCLWYGGFPHNSMTSLYFIDTYLLKISTSIPDCESLLPNVCIPSFFLLFFNMLQWSKIYIFPLQHYSLFIQQKKSQECLSLLCYDRLVFVYIAGAVGILWFLLWIPIGYSSPATHPRISKQERNYIESSIAAEGTASKVTIWINLTYNPND